ncbi:uncharacterized protein N7498_004506 [Penicillium cinerascens]|uniref:Leucine-rich repeat domain-containing protein n=1 Tax=Penicillium cinerascens TaxID=70096 RepID=A0A9W9SZD3_9EURO|nr:uncharacterized protein N7498_004506 [Penicillium cinerascens]KAJ5203627.1 hypothetical protein N7498_004506 [Penicillium cinerascens]
MKSFFHAVTQRPVLASSVRELDLSGWQTEAVSDDEREIIENETVPKGLVTASSHSIEEAIQWKKSLKKGYGDAWIALIFPLLTHIRQLQLSYAKRTYFKDLTLQRAVNGEKLFHNRHAFQCLREFSFYRRDRVDCVDPPQQSEDTMPPSAALLISFFHFPSVRAIVADAVIDPSSITSAVNRQTGFSSVFEINLRASCGNQGMEALVASCADLKSFQYQHSDSHILSHGYQPTALYRSLARSRETLQTLSLDHYGNHYPFTAASLNQNRDEWFGSLSDFTFLRDLCIRLPNLLDIQYQSDPTMALVHCFPLSLGILYIEGCKERHLVMLVAQLLAILKNRATCVPKLRHVDIEGPFQNTSSNFSSNISSISTQTIVHTVNSKIVQAVELLHEGCITAGVHFYVHDRAFTQKSPV